MPSSISPYTPRNRDRLVRLAQSAGRFVGSLRTERHIRQWGQQQRQAADRETRLWELRNAPRARRALDFSGQVTRAGAAMPINAGATNVIQRAVIKQRSGKRVRRKSVNYLYKLQKAVTSTAVLRWQAMSEYDSNGRLEIGYSRINTAGFHYFPVYLFDVTSCHLTVPDNAGTQVRLESNPMYRLSNDSSGNFGWSVVNGLAPDGTVSGNWFTETSRGANALGNSPNMGTNAMLGWSDIRLALYGATNQSTRFNVSFIQFVDESYHPRSTRDNPAVQPNVTADTTDQQGRFNAAMEELTKPLVYHPMHSAGNAQNVMRVITSRSFVVQPDTSTNEGKASPNVCYKLFKRMNRICKWTWQTSDKKATTTTTEHKIDPVLGMDVAPSYNQYFGGTKRPYVHPNARIYMMITAQAYTRTALSPVDPVIPVTAANTPTFDIMVRNKWLYDAT